MTATVVILSCTLELASALAPCILWSHHLLPAFQRLHSLPSHQPLGQPSSNLPKEPS
ncbi:hypothetical protein L207DRAFT_510935 [Hyaloscypha variabilis F]|uniref:Uncharacterized protein n=1 Tax=Hyaloscypha variabilis (strain UAMH 11265 / GT02V1 / F) TaxID=1149755 RepID=A0A2J6RW20_HYAVF|nr:hypothetical protein L207DRAFT_510935 [Hyaloscypha variabilis F]